MGNVISPRRRRRLPPAPSSARVAPVCEPPAPPIMARSRSVPIMQTVYDAEDDDDDDKHSSPAYADLSCSQQQRISQLIREELTPESRASPFWTATLAQ